MKKLQLFFTVFLMFVFSCTKNESDALQEHTELLDELSFETQAVLQQTDLTSMKQGYSMLSDIEQERLWKAKLSYIIKHDKLSDSQRNLLKSIYNLLAKNGISNMKADNSIGENYFTANKDVFYRNFSTQQLFFIIEHPFIKPGFSLKYAKEYFSSMSFKTSQNTGSNELVVEGSCQCLYDIGCGFGNICNKNAPCSGGSDCGFFGTSRCKGVCERANGGPVL